MKNTKVPEEQVSKIVESFQDGKEIGPISREFGLSRAGVRKILQREEVYETRKNTQYKLTEEQKVLAIRSYLDGKDISDLASEYSFSGRGMLSLLQREEVYKGRKRTRKVTEEQTEEIVSAYQEGERVASLARRFPLSETGVSDLLKREGAYKTGRDNRRYQVDESLFERIDTPDKAYWLGFISADGHVGDYVVRIRLGIKDRAHLERFRSFMQSDHPIVDTYGQCGTPVSEIYISSRRLSKSFRCLGLSSNKTFSITPCEQVPDNLLRHYWRGAVDGDGWILERKRASGKSGWVIGLCSASPKFLEGFREFIVDHIPSFQGRVAHSKGELYRLRANGISVPRQLAHILYYGADTYLPRKMGVAQRVMHAEGDLRDLSFIDDDFLTFLYERFNKNWAAAARYLDIRPGNFTTFRNKHYREHCSLLMQTPSCS